MPVQVSSGLCGFRNLTGIFPPLAAARGAACELRKDVAQLVAVRSEAALDLAPEILPPFPFAGSHFALSLADELGQLIDVEAGKIDVCHCGFPRNGCAGT